MGYLGYSVGDMVELQVNDDVFEPLDAKYDGQVVQITSIDEYSDYPYASAGMTASFCDADIECIVGRAEIPKDTEPLLEWELI